MRSTSVRYWGLRYWYSWYKHANVVIKLLYFFKEQYLMTLPTFVQTAALQMGGQASTYKRSIHECGCQLLRAFSAGTSCPWSSVSLSKSSKKIVHVLWGIFKELQETFSFSEEKADKENIGKETVAFARSFSKASSSKEQKKSFLSHLSSREEITGNISNRMRGA